MANFIGVEISTSNNSIGGTAAGAGNVVSGNQVHGILVNGSAATGNVVQGNLIGTNASGTAAIANAFFGVYMVNGASNNLVGGTFVGSVDRNVISGNSNGIQLQSLSHKVAAAQEQAKAIPLADDVAVLARWLRADAFAVSALPYADRAALFDFIVTELQARTPLCPHRLGPVCTLLQNHRDQLLAFAWQLDEDLTTLAAEFEVPLAIVRELLDLQTLDKCQPLRWQKERVDKSPAELLTGQPHPHWLEMLGYRRSCQH